MKDILLVVLVSMLIPAAIFSPLVVLTFIKARKNQEYKAELLSRMATPLIWIHKWQAFPRRNKFQILALLSFLIVAFASLIVLSDGRKVYWNWIFKSQLSDYASGDAARRLDPFISGFPGKVVVVDADAEEVDEIHNALPPAIRASSPEQVGTVARLHWKTVSAGEYVYVRSRKRAGQAEKWTCSLELLDLAQRNIIGKAEFSGSGPPDTMNGISYGRGERPNADIVSYICSLPKRQ